MCVKFEGRVTREGSHWAVYVPALDIYTQGKSRRDAMVMIKEAVVLILDKEGVDVAVSPLSGDRFIVHAKRPDDDRYLMALMLKNQRAKYGLSISQVASRLAISKNAYAQYEQARAVPSIAKVEAFIHAMSNRAHVVLDVLDEAMAA